MVLEKRKYHDIKKVKKIWKRKREINVDNIEGKIDILKTQLRGFII